MIRHFIAFVGALIALIIYLAGYFSGVNGWIWTVVSVLFVYLIVYKLVDA